MAWEMKYQPNVVLDFDGVIHSYVSGWQGVDVVPDPPVPLIDEEIKRIRAAGYRVVVVSTRCATPEGMGAVRRYLRENGIEVDDVAAEKPPAKVYVDDRALLFDGNRSRPMLIRQSCWKRSSSSARGKREGLCVGSRLRRTAASVSPMCMSARTTVGARMNLSHGSTHGEAHSRSSIMEPSLSRQALSRTSTVRCGTPRRRISGSSTERRTADAD